MSFPVPLLARSIQHWLQHLKVKGAAIDTSRAYKRDLQHLVDTYPKERLSLYTQAELQDTLAKLHIQGLQPRSLARILSAWRNFFNWACEKYQLTYNPTFGVTAPLGRYPAPKILSIEQTKKLLDIGTPSLNDDASVWRDQAIFELLYSSGLRLAEIIALDIEPIETTLYQSKAWIDLAQKELNIHTNTERQRTVPIGEPALKAIQAWLIKRPALLPALTKPATKEQLDSLAALFIGVRGQRISPRVIQKQLQLRAKKVGIEHAVYPHRLRNSFANHLLESSNDVKGVQQLLGHANVISTQSLQQLNPEQLAQFLAMHPRHQKKPME